MKNTFNQSASETNSQNWDTKISQSDEYVKDMLVYFAEGWDARGLDDSRKDQDRLRVNVVNTLTYIEQVNAALNDLNIQATASHIKANSFFSFTVLFLIPLESYLSEEFLNVYFITSMIEKKSKSEDYCVNFTFTFDDGNINEEALTCDGYFRSHVAIK